MLSPDDKTNQIIIKLYTKYVFIDKQIKRNLILPG